jgi:RimJ/RimL family protein N-acetyltransferase
MKIKGSKVILRPKIHSDAENDYRWQIDPELSALDAMKPYSLSFQEFYREYIDILKNPHPNRVTFGVDTYEGKHIGNCVYYNIDDVKHETEIGIMIGNRDYWNKGYGTDIISTLIDHIFQHLKFKRVYLKTLEMNLRAQKCFKKCGMISCGYRELDGHKFLLMEMLYDKWQELRSSDKITKTKKVD